VLNTVFGSVRWRPQPDVEVRIEPFLLGRVVAEDDLLTMARAARPASPEEWADLARRMNEITPTIAMPPTLEDTLRGWGRSTEILAGPIELSDGVSLALAADNVLCEQPPDNWWNCNELYIVPKAFELWTLNPPRLLVGDGIERIEITYADGSTIDALIEQPFPDALASYRLAIVQLDAYACAEGFDSDGISVGKVLLDTGAGFLTQQQYEDAFVAACGEVEYEQSVIAMARRGETITVTLPPDP
jgi:hypothetical protein